MCIRDRSVSDVGECLCRFLGARVPVTVSGNFRLGDIRHNYACLEKIGRLLAFRPRVGFEEGIARYCEWARSAGSMKSDYDASLMEMRQKGLLK